VYRAELFLKDLPYELRVEFFIPEQPTTDFNGTAYYLPRPQDVAL